MGGTNSNSKKERKYKFNLSLFIKKKEKVCDICVAGARSDDRPVHMYQGLARNVQVTVWDSIPALRILGVALFLFGGSIAGSVCLACL